MSDQLITFLLGCLQTGLLLVVYRQVSRIHLSIFSIIVFFAGSILANLLLNHFFFIVVLLLFYWIGINGGLNHRKSLASFYGLYSVSFFSLVGSLFSAINQQFLDNVLLLNIGGPFIPVLVNYLVLQIARPDFKFLRDNYDHITHQFLMAINTLLFILCSLLYGSYFWEDHIGSLGELRYALTAGFIVLELVIIFYLNMKIRLLQETQLEQLREEQLKQLSQYTNQVETLYNKIRGIRHDYVNVMSSLDEGIKAHDFAKVEHTYNSVLKRLGVSLQSNRYDLTRLSNIKIEAVKGLLAAKIIEALEKHIETTVEVLKPVTKCYIDLLDYIRILSVFLDNAIEASVSAKKPSLAVAIISNEVRKEQVLIVSNSCADDVIDKRQIFKSGFSTKGANRGLGLAIVKELLLEHANLSLETQYEDHLFTQKLTLREAV